MSNIEMREVFCSKLEEWMAKDERIVVIDSDLARANGTLRLREKFPGRALDVGVAESNMASMAAGLSSYGFIPFIGSFAPFSSRRICDQLAISICYAKQNVKIIGSDPGVTAEFNGGTHMSFEDIGVLRSLPGIVIFEPADEVQLRQGIDAAIDHDGPVYIRLFRKPAEEIYSADYKFDLFKADVLREGNSVAIFSSGIMCGTALTAAKMLADDGISAEVVNVHTIKPLDEETVLRSASKCGCAVTAENHSIIGGLRSAVAEVLSGRNPMPLKAVGVQDHFGEVAKAPYLLKKYGMTAEDIAAAAKESINMKEGLK